MAPDAIVIGSGPNGLAAAIRLADAGRDVLVLEAQEHLGGAVRTQELTLPGFRHDTFSSVFPAAAASPVLGRMPLADHGLRWTQPEVCYAHPLPDGSAPALHADLESTVRMLDDRHRGDGAAWRAFAEPLLRQMGPIRATMLSGFPPVAGPLRLLGRGGLRTALGFARLLPGSATGLGRRLFVDQGSRAWLLGASMHGDTPPDAPGGAIAAAYLNLLGHAFGWPSAQGGAQAITDALVAHLRTLGGEARTNARVERVVTRAGAVRGVCLQDGERIDAPVVLATVLPHALLRLVPDLPPRYAASLGRYVLGPGTVKVDWALDGPIPWTAESARRAGTVHIGGDEAETVHAVTVTRTGLPERPFLLLGQPSIADPSRAPEGRHTAWAYTHGPNPRGPHAGTVDWAAEQEAHVARMEAHVERFAPGFGARVLARHVLGPAELEGRDANLAGGDVGAGSYALRQVLFRPVPRPSPYRTPIAGLLLAGASTFPGGAVHGVPGDAAARAVLRRRRALSSAPSSPG